MMDDSAPLSDDLASLYRADPRQDAIDLDKGWASVRPRLDRRVVPRRVRVFVMSLAAAGALAASVLLILRAVPRTPDVPYRQAVADLEQALRSGRDRLPPESRAAIDQSLAAIERAMRDAEAASAADPTNEYVVDWLEVLRRRKLNALRQAVGDLHAAS